MVEEVIRQRMYDWIGQVIDNYLGLIYRSIRKGLFEGDYIQIDETPVPYVEKGGMGKSRKGYFWVFGHPTTGHRSAVIYTLIESCKRHGIEPQAYLTDLLERLPAMTNHEAEELTPDKWEAPGLKKAI